MPPEKPNATDAPGELAKRITEALLRERVVPRFVDSYVVENGRQALLALTVRALEIVCDEPQPAGKSKPRPMLRRDATAFRRKYLASLARQQGWTAGDTLDFQRDLQIYQELLARAAAKGRPRKPFEVADHPFVDRCAFLLDSSFMENARLAASRALSDLESLACQLTIGAHAPPAR